MNYGDPYQSSMQMLDPSQIPDYPQMQPSSAQMMQPQMDYSQMPQMQPSSAEMMGRMMAQMRSAAPPTLSLAEQAMQALKSVHEQAPAPPSSALLSDTAAPAIQSPAAPAVQAAQALPPVQPVQTVQPVEPVLQLPQQVQIPQLPASSAELSVPAAGSMTYKKFQVSDIFYSKVGISIITSVASFVSLIIINPPFIHENVDDDIRCPKPNYLLAYIFSVVVFIAMMLIPMGTRQKAVA
jgi:hypothetical protein